MNAIEINNDSEEVIIIENPETINGEIYHGEIVSIHTGYVFIHNVKRGYETILTNGDVFCPVPENHNFETGELVQFNELNPDKERVGKFRTESISKIKSTEESDSRIMQIQTLSKSESPYHRIRKMISENDTEKAAENKPLVEFVEQVKHLLNNESGYSPEIIVKISEDFVANTFPMVVQLGIKCSIQGNVDLPAEKQLVDETIQLYNESDLAGQAESLQKEYSQLLAVRNAFTLMHKNNLLNYWSVISYHHLPELTFAFPVWFVHGKKYLPDSTEQTDPEVDHAVSFICDCVGSKEYAWFYQMYNRRTRPLSHFKGKDIMPPAIVRIMNEAKENFDYLAIMTPYHDVASKEWSDPNWLRNIDPILVGFLKGLPYMFVLGRWSGTGIFPLLLDCIADTKNHIEINKTLLSGFKQNTYWYKGNNNNCLSDSSNALVVYADKLLKAYNEGLLFQFLRGELSKNQEYLF